MIRAFLMWLFEVPSPVINPPPGADYNFEIFGRLQANRKRCYIRENSINGSIAVTPTETGP